MAGKKQRQANQKDFKDPFNAGQMIGMMVALTFVQKNNGIPQELLEQLQWTCATNASEYLEKPAEDVFLFVDQLVKEIK